MAAPRLIAIALLLAVLGSAAALAGAERPAPEPTGLFLVPHTAEGDAALAAPGVRTVARYESFTLVEAEGERAERLVDAGAQRRDDMRKVRLGRRALDPLFARRGLGRRDRALAEREAALAVVQFVGPVKDSWLERLRGTGLRIVRYVPQNAYLVHGSGPRLARAASELNSDPAVRTISAVEPRDKLPAPLGASGRVRVEVQTLAGDDGRGARRAALAAGERARQPVEAGGIRAEHVVLDADELPALLADPGVVAVLPDAEPKLVDERQAMILANSLLNSSGNSVPVLGDGYIDFLTGEGFGTATFDFAVDITDEGLDTGSTTPDHDDFYENGNGVGTSRVAYASNWTTDVPNGARDCGGHGTINAGIATGYNGLTSAEHEENGFNYDLGIAPRARVGSSKIFSCVNGIFQVGPMFPFDLSEAAYEAGARISSNSWAADTFGTYDADALAYDEIVRDADDDVAGNQQMVEVFAASNAGPGPNTVGTPGVAKNVITVGASEGVRPLGAADGCGVGNPGADDAADVIDFSSRGPTDDFRVKPEVVAPGTHITGAQSQALDYNGTGVCNSEFPAGSALYALSSGTSHSTPAVAGAAAILRDWYTREVPGGAPPSPAMTKAILANTATDLAGGENGAGGTNGNAPDQVQGWGRVNLASILGATARDLRDEGTLLTASGEQFLQSYDVPNTTAPVKVSLAWTDVPNAALVNDLDLEVVANGDTFHGNALAGGVSVPGGSADRRNNLENVFLPAGISGTITVRVRATTIAGDGVPGAGDMTDQDFALVVSNATQASTPAVLTQGETEVLDADSDGTIEPGESFDLRQTFANIGSSTATGLTGTLSSSSSTLSLTRESSAYPDIPAGGSGANQQTFQGTLGAPHECGAPLPLQVAVGGGAAGRSIVSLPTHTGTDAKVTRTSTDVPRSIPDGNAASFGEAQLAVEPPGRIGDLDVRLSISHSYVEDLRISLIAPDGTEVVLADSRGGSGNNYTNTIFDDEASQAIGSGAAPFNGRFRPEQPLSVLDGKPLSGTWRLRVVDVFPQDAGSIQAFHLETGQATCGASRLAIADSSVGEGAPGATGPAAFTVSLSEAATEMVSVDYATAPVTATAGSDFGEEAATVTFAPGETEKTISIEVIGDALDEEDETFSVELRNAANADLADPAGTGTIVDDDAPPAISVGSVTTPEGSAGLTQVNFPVTLSAPSGRPVSVSYASAPGTAVSPGDFTAVPPTTLTFSPGETQKLVSVQVVGDTVDETDENFSVQLSAPQNASAGTMVGVGTIVDDDPPAAGGSNGTTTVPPTTGPATTPPPAPDRTAPRIALRVPRSVRLRTALSSRGILARVACDEGCEIEVAATMQRRLARRFGIAARHLTTVGRGFGRLRGAGTRSVRIRLTRSARKRLVRARRVPLALTFRVTDPAGNRRTATRRIVLRR